jgi:hypothetical protein
MATNKKICLACNPDKSEHNIKDFYSSKNPMHKDGLVPWCKDCIKKNSVLENGEIDENKLKNVLRQIDKPYYKDMLQSAITQFKKEHSFVNEDEIKFYGSDIIGLYFKNINTLRQVQAKSYEDSMKEGFVRNKGVQKKDIDEIKNAKTNKEEEIKHYSDLGDFVATDEIKELFGDGYSDLEYKKMYEKYEKLKLNYSLQTNLHQEALATYVRFKVKEEESTALGNVDDAKKWYDAAQNAAEKAKLTPKQLTKADLQSGVSSMCELTKALEQAVDVIKILPQFKYRPNDAPDFNIYCYISYERELNGQPQVDYSEIYSFYDRKKNEYLAQNGDPYGIFDNDTSEKNRDVVKTFIKLPDDYDDMAGDQSGD